MKPATKSTLIIILGLIIYFLSLIFIEITAYVLAGLGMLVLAALVIFGLGSIWVDMTDHFKKEK